MCTVQCLFSPWANRILGWSLIALLGACDGTVSQCPSPMVNDSSIATSKLEQQLAQQQRETDQLRALLNKTTQQLQVAQATVAEQEQHLQTIKQDRQAQALNQTTIHLQSLEKQLAAQQQELTQLRSELAAAKSP